MVSHEIAAIDLKSFTTAPKLRRFIKHGAFISSNRAKEFMEHLWKVGLKKCSYETLEWEFITYFESNDKRTIERYLGRPERLERLTGLSKVVRMNRMSGKIAQFEYLNERCIQAKKGLLEILGYISKVKEGSETRYIIQHERMPYYTVQTSLEKEAQKGGNLLQESSESSEESKEDLCVCSLYDNCSLKGKEVFSANRETDDRGDKKEKKEVIDCTHTNLEKTSIQTVFRKIGLKKQTNS